jgi:hypothetical protein
MAVSLTQATTRATTRRASRGMMLPTSYFKFLRILVSGNN